MSRIPRIAIPLKAPEDVIPHLGKPTHWKQGRSAKAVAESWFIANDLPPEVRRVLETSPLFVGCTLIDGWLERSTDLGDDRSTHSQTDLLAILGLENSLAVLGVEAKVTESFGPLVSKWAAVPSLGKRKRLEKLCRLFNVDPESVGNLRYQLFHRTAAAIYEAHRYKTNTAVLIVHSFCNLATGFSDFETFMRCLGFLDIEIGRVSGPLSFGDVQLWIGWVADECPS